MNRVPEKRYIGPVTVYSKHVSSQCNLTAQLEPAVQYRTDSCVNNEQGLQEKVCKVEQDCFGAQGTD